MNERDHRARSRVLAFAVLTFALAFASCIAFAEGEPEPPTSANQAVPNQPGYAPGKGFDLAKEPLGSLNVSAYVLLRYLNQLPPNQTFTDHLGRVQTIDPRNDIELHRILIHFRGFLFTPKLRHQTSVWAVNSTNSVTAISALNYEVTEALVLGGGIGALPGTRSMNYEHPYFLGTDRQMADEFFRPSFTAGVWASGDLPQRLQYRVMLGDNLNIVNISAGQLTRDFAYGATIAWLPTTGEFGPKGGFGDLEIHDRLATRFGVSGTHSREDRYSQVNNPNPDNTTIRLSDSLALFQTGALAPDSTMQKTDFWLLSTDASMKYRGFFLFGEAYFRLLDDFDVVGPAVPVDAIHDSGFMIQTSYLIVPRYIEPYLAHSQIFGQFNRAWELTGGVNYYPFRNRNLKLNGSVTYVDRSPVSSLFGYFVGGQKGPTIALCTDFTF